MDEADVIAQLEATINESLQVFFNAPLNSQTMVAVAGCIAKILKSRWKDQDIKIWVARYGPNSLVVTGGNEFTKDLINRIFPYERGALFW